MPVYGDTVYPSFYVTAPPAPIPDPFDLLDASLDSGDVIFDDMLMTFDAWRTEPCATTYLHGSYSSAIFMHGSC